jgi:hypothetical protein
LEKYWRNGDLTLSPNATLKSASYLKSVKNRFVQLAVFVRVPLVILVI